MLNTSATNGVMNMLYFLIEGQTTATRLDHLGQLYAFICAIVVYISNSSNILLSVPAVQKAVFAPLSSETIWNDWPVRYPNQTTQQSSAVRIQEGSTR